ncbi:hypothetical protein [uncultured Salinisphaera sp.]
MKATERGRAVHALDGGYAGSSIGGGVFVAACDRSDGQACHVR